MNYGDIKLFNYTNNLHIMAETWILKNGNVHVLVEKFGES